MENEGRKDDGEKIRFDLIPPDALSAMVHVLTFGADKYGDRNWERGMSWGRLIGAAHRHLNAIQRGEDLDKETGLPHAAHLACCAFFLTSYYLRGAGTDDRAKLPSDPREPSASP